MLRKLFVIVKNLFAANGGLYDLEGIIEPVLLPEP